MHYNDVFGLEFDWFAVDHDGHIGHFSSAGYGPIPRAALDNANAQEQLLAYFHEQPAQTDAEFMIAQVGTLDDWLAMARHGLFSYDYGESYGPYTLIARPARPTIIRALPASIQQFLRQVS